LNGVSSPKGENTAKLMDKSANKWGQTNGNEVKPKKGDTARTMLVMVQLNEKEDCDQYLWG